MLRIRRSISFQNLAAIPSIGCRTRPLLHGEFRDVAVRIRGGGDGKNKYGNDVDVDIQSAEIAPDETPANTTTTVETTSRVSPWTTLLIQTRQSIQAERIKLHAVQLLKVSQLLASKLGPAALIMAALRYNMCRTEHDVQPLTLYGLALLGASCGFHLFLYFITLGFALGVTVPLVVSLFVYQKQSPLPTLTVIHSAVTIVWGLRLFSFLTIREYVSWPALHQKVVEVQAKMNIPFASKLLCWLVYSFFYVALMASCWSRHLQGAAMAATASDTLPAVAWGVLGHVGLLMQSTGLVLESVADMQKTNFKSRNHFTWCNVGLWRFSTHPNYLGEGLFWLGTYLAHGFYALLPSAFATAGLAFIMVVLKGSARSLASKQKEKYGQDPEFCDFQRTHNVFGPKHWWLKMPDNGNNGDEPNNGSEATTIPELATTATNPNS